MSSNTVSFECGDLPIEKTVVFNDRAEIRKKINAELQKGDNQVIIKNVPSKFILDSLRVDGRGDATIHDVIVRQPPPIPVVETEDSPKKAEIRESMAAKKREIEEARGRALMLAKRTEVLDKLVDQIGSGALPKDGSAPIDDALLKGIGSLLGFYEQNTTTTQKERIEVAVTLERLEEEYNSLKKQLDTKAGTGFGRVFEREFVVFLESVDGGSVELDIVYQTTGASWKPSYDLRMDTRDRKLQLHYFAKVTQRTGEDWRDVPLVLSTSQPSLGGTLPVLGTMEVTLRKAVFHSMERNGLRFAPSPSTTSSSTVLFGSAQGASGSLFGSPSACQNEKAVKVAPVMEHAVVSHVEETILSTEFPIARKTTIPNNSEDHKVTIGIISLSPQLVHECVPSKNLSVFLTASAINTSQLPILRGEASVYLNNSFVAKTAMKNVSPGERFSASLGVDTAVRAEYKPAKKYHEQVGIINKSSSTVTEQVIILKNTKTDPVLIIVKEHIPRSTDDKIKIRVVNPANVAPHEDAVSVHDAPPTPREGAKMTAQHNLEWTVKLTGGQIFEMNLKWALEHPKEEKIEFHENF